MRFAVRNNIASGKNRVQQNQDVCDNTMRSDLYQALIPACHLSKVWGALPVKFAKTSPEKYQGRLSPFEVTYSVCLLLSLIGCEIWGLWRDLRDGWENSTRMKSKTAVVVTCSDVIAVGTLASVTVLGAPFRWNKIQAIMDTLVEVDEKLGIVAAKKTRRFSILLISGALIYLSTASMIDYYIWDMQVKKMAKKKDKGAINYVPVYFLYVIVMVMEIQIALAAYNIGQRFVRLNKSLENMLRSKRLASFFPNDLTMGDIGEQKLFRTVIKGENRGEPLFRIRKVSELELIRNSVANFAEVTSNLLSVHSSLSDTVLQMNSTFGLPALVTVLTCLLHLIVTPYFLILEANGDHNEWFLTVQLMWCIGHVGRLLIIVQPCYSATVEARGTSILVSQLLSVNWESDVRKQLELFSLQLLHRPLEFSACGLCALDRPLVTSIAGAVTTYLVILIQFQKEDETQDATIILKNATQLLKNASSLHNATARRV